MFDQRDVCGLSMWAMAVRILWRTPHLLMTVEVRFFFSSCRVVHSVIEVRYWCRAAPMSVTYCVAHPFEVMEGVALYSFRVCFIRAMV